MNKRRNNEKYFNFARSNRQSVAPGHTVVPTIVQLKKDMKSAAGNAYAFFVVQTLNRSPVFVQFAPSKDKVTKVSTPYQPAMKRVKRTEGAEEEASEEASEEIEVPEDDRVSKRDGAYGVVLKPFSTIMVTSYDRAGASALDVGKISKMSLIADFYRDNVNYKAGDIILDNGAAGDINGEVFERYFLNGEMGVIPTLDNIDPASFPADTNPKYYKRPFVLPLSDDTPQLFNEVEIVVDPEDPKSFVAKRKEDDVMVPSVTIDVGQDRVRNGMSVVYGTTTAKYFMQYAYRSDIWAPCFGITCVDKWVKSAGRMIFSASKWYAYGSSSLEDIRSMRGNAESESDGLDYGYGGGVDDDVDDSPSAPMQRAAEGGMVTTTGFISTMSLDLPGTIKKAGLPLSKEWVEGKYGPSGEYSFESTDMVDHPLNKSWRSKLIRGLPLVLNVTEADDGTRYVMLKELASNPRATYYGIFAAGDDRPYEHTGTDTPLEAMLDEAKIMPSTLFVVV